MLIYHITHHKDWEQARTAGHYSAPSLAAEGFIHASTREQVVGTANFLFKGQEGLVLLEINSERLAAELRFEEAPGTGIFFPHIYGPLNLDAVNQVVAFPAGEQGEFSLPAKINMD